MIDLSEINSTIKKLEHGETTYSNCDKLAALYTVRDHMTSAAEVMDEISDKLRNIIVLYTAYQEMKKKYHSREVSEQPVVVSMNQLCRDIKEFMVTLYKNTETDEERTQLKQMIKALHDMM